MAPRLPASLRPARLWQLASVLRRLKPPTRQVAVAQAQVRLAGVAVPVTGDGAGPAAPGHPGTCGNAMSAEEMLSTQYVL